MRLFALGIVLLLSACASRLDAPIIPAALSVGVIKPVFVGTTRARNEDGTFGFLRQHSLNLLELAVSIPKDRAPGSISNGQNKPRPGRDFTLASLEQFPNPVGFKSALRRELSRDGSGDATIYVHGFNNSFSDAAFRVAQLAHDFQISGAAISYSWPSRASALGYNYDTDSALFARDGLVQLMRQTKAAGARRIVLVGHSMGGSLIMEALRQLEISTPGWAAANLSGVLLISPDLNVDVFRSQVSHFKKWPQPFVIFVSRKDIVLKLSARIRGERVRLGNMAEIEAIADLPISFVDVTAFTDRESGNHFVVGGSEAFVRLLRASDELDEAFLRGRQSVLPTFSGRRVVLNATEFVLRPDDR